MARFIDEAEIHVSAGNGGPGCVSFRREKYEPRGGPNGGNGGRGGGIVFETSDQISSLLDFRYRRIYKANNGSPGGTSDCDGADGQDLVIRVPVGTLIKDREKNRVLFDLDQPGFRFTLCKGGRGGKGNAHFATARYRAPKFAQPGEPGERLDITLELKILADVGIIGKPNAGKSTLLSHVSAAKPKVADYPFTTLKPNLGVVQLPEGRTGVFADIPGLIRYAHRGQGLGLQFLRHIERTKCLVHLLDGSHLLEAKHPLQGVDAIVEDYLMIREELSQFKDSLISKPEIVVVNKADVIPSDQHQKWLKTIHESLKKHSQTYRSNHSKLFLASGVSGEGLQNLLYRCDQLIEANRTESTTGEQPGLLRSDSLPSRDVQVTEEDIRS